MVIEGHIDMPGAPQPLIYLSPVPRRVRIIFGHPAFFILHRLPPPPRPPPDCSLPPKPFQRPSAALTFSAAALAPRTLSALPFFPCFPPFFSSRASPLHRAQVNDPAHSNPLETAGVNAEWSHPAPSRADEIAELKFKEALGTKLVLSMSGWEGMLPAEAESESAEPEREAVVTRNLSRNRQLLADLKILGSHPHNPVPSALWPSFSFTAAARADGFSIAFDEIPAKRPEAGDPYEPEEVDVRTQAIYALLQIAHKYGQHYVTMLKLEYGRPVRRRLYTFTRDMSLEEQLVRGEREIMRVMTLPPGGRGLSASRWEGTSDAGDDDYQSWHRAWSGSLVEWWQRTADPGKKAAWSCAAALSRAMAAQLQRKMGFGGIGERQMAVASRAAKDCTLFPESKTKSTADSPLVPPDLPMIPERVQAPFGFTADDVMPARLKEWSENESESNELTPMSDRGRGGQQQELLAAGARGGETPSLLWGVLSAAAAGSAAGAALLLGAALFGRCGGGRPALRHADTERRRTLP